MVRRPRGFIAPGRSPPLLCLSHPSTLGIRFRAPGRPITGVTSTRTPLMLLIGSYWLSTRRRLAPLPADIQKRIIPLVCRVGARLLAARGRGSAPKTGGYVILRAAGERRPLSCFRWSLACKPLLIRP